MTIDPGVPSNTGRPITLTEVPPGLTLLVGGGVVATMGPMFGFLIGTIMGSGTDVASLEPIYLFLLLGLAIGGLGIGMMILGVRRYLRSQGSVLVDSPSGSKASAPDVG